MTKLKKLFEPIKLDSLELPNRIIMSAMSTGYDSDLEKGDRWVNFYAARARGGVGLIIVGTLQAIYPSRKFAAAGVNINHDKYIPRLKAIARAIHSNGGRAAAQLGVYGHWAKKGWGTTPEDVGPSLFDERKEFSREDINPRLGLAEILHRDRGLTLEEIHMIEEQVIEAGVRAREAEFDAMELQVVGGNLLCRFTNPFTNRRTDEYGGSLENRVRIITNIIANTKKRVGTDFPIICRIAGLDMVPWGLTLDDWKEIAPLIEKAGACALNVMPGWHEAKAPRVQMSVPRGAFVYVAEGIKQVVNIPVASGTQINDPLLAEQILAEGKADLIAMGRPLIADPYFTSKAKAGQFEDINMCTFCCNCYDCLIYGQPVTCAVNALAGREIEHPITPAAQSKKVFIIGGGPAGMEAARIAALRGHRVTLFEKKAKLGGQLRYAVLVPYQNEWQSIINYLTSQINKLNVAVKLKEEGTVRTIEEGKPDAVIVAMGATHWLPPDIPGIDGENVATAVEVLTGVKEVGQNVVIVGGGCVGCGTAEFLHQRGKKVTILEMLPVIGHGIGVWHRSYYIDRLLSAHIRLEVMSRVVEITEKGAWIGLPGKNLEFYEADTVIIAAGMKPVNTLAKELESKVAELYQVGDCIKPRKVKDAIEEGFLTAIKI